MSYEYFENLDANAKTRYRKKLEVSNLSECPYKLASTLWKDDTSIWPNIQYGDIYDYLINTPGNRNSFTMLFVLLF